MREQANKTIHILEDHGYEAYIVGGAVRNLLLQLPVRDFDLCTNASLVEMKEIFPKHTDIGGNFGTLLVHQGKHAFEVSQFKTGHLEEKPSIITDLRYRDFSCNAMAMTKDGSLIDPYNGQEAVEKKLIQVVNDDPQRLMDDPLRLLRGIRLALSLDFQIEEQTERFMREFAGLIKEPAKERIVQELEKLFELPVSKKKLSYFLSHPVVWELPLLFPERDRLFGGLEKLDSSFFIQGSIQGWMLATYSEDPNKTMFLLNEYRCSKQIRKALSTIIRQVIISKKDGKLRDEQLYILKASGIESACKLLSILLARRIDDHEYLEQFQRLPIHNLSDVVISGSDLLQWFPIQAQSGAWIGKTLKEIERKILLGDLNNDKKMIYEWVKKETFS